jgi:hypothetical protein
MTQTLPRSLSFNDTHTLTSLQWLSLERSGWDGHRTELFFELVTPPALVPGEKFTFRQDPYELLALEN